MFRQLCAGIIILLTLTACGSKNTASRQNDFAILTSMRIVGPTAIAANTSAKLTVIGNYSGLFERDITDQVTWASSNPAVASFSFPTFPSRVKGVAPGTAILTATSGTVKGTANLTVTNATLSALSITPATPSVPNGLTQQFSASGTFSDASTQDLTLDVDWSSSATSVATISNDIASKGVAKATASAGTSTINATATSISATPPATTPIVASTVLTAISPVVQSITVSPSQPSVLSLSTITFTATGKFSDGSTANITNSVTWSSSQTGIATVTTGGVATGIGTGSNIVGNSTISASLNGISGSTNLKVTGGNLTGYTLTPASMTLAAGTVGRITATGNFDNNTTRDITGKLQWVSANPAVATVTQPSGNLITTQAVATTQTSTNITATLGTFSASATVTATVPLLSSITITPASADLTVGASTPFTLTGNFGGTTQDLTLSADWTAANTTFTSAGNTGLDKGWVKGVTATAVATPVTIGASFGSPTLTAQAAVTVTNRTLQSIAISGFPTTFTPGTQATLIVKATYSDGTILDVTRDAVISIDNPNVFVLADSQNQSGTIVVVNSGTANVKVTFSTLSQTTTFTIP